MRSGSDLSFIQKYGSDRSTPWSRWTCGRRGATGGIEWYPVTIAHATKSRARQVRRRCGTTSSNGSAYTVLPDRPTTVFAWNKEFNTASSVASTTAAK